MSDRAREYAVSLFELASENDMREEYALAMDTLCEAFLQNPGYAEILSAPTVGKEEKYALIEEAFGDMPKDVRGLIALLSVKGSSDIICDAAKEYAALESSASGRVDAVITSASELSDFEKRRLEENLERRFGKVVDAEYFVDEALIGGIIVKCGDTVIDGSIRKGLLDMKEVIE